MYNLSPLDMEILLSLAGNMSKEYILAHPEKKISPAQVKKFNSFCLRRSNGEPIAYISGKKEFFGLEFLVNQNVLIPRPETEMLVEKSIEKINSFFCHPALDAGSSLKSQLKTFLDPRFYGDDNMALMDIGTGSGNIIISIAKIIPKEIQKKINFYAVDISKESLRVAKENAKKYKLDKKLKFIQSNLLEYFFKNKIKQKKNFIVANLPYLDQKWKNLLDSSESKGLKFEPRIALEGGPDGLDEYRGLAKHIRDLKVQNEQIDIALFCEIGHIQKSGIKDIFSFARKIKFHRDLAGKWRVAEIEITS